MKKYFSIAGMLSGAIVVVLGIMMLCGVFESPVSTGEVSPYDSGYASFGADYYTYSVNNTAEAASAARAAAGNLCDILCLLQICFGLLFIVSGAVIICGFGIAFSGCIKSADKSDVELCEINSEADICDDELIAEEEETAGESTVSDAEE